jgi:hypothetical protein
MTIMRYFLMCILLAFAMAPTSLAQHSEKYKNCKKACRAAHDTASAECKKKPTAEQQACQNAAKAAVTKCKGACTE